MAAIAYPVRSGQTRVPQRTRRQRRGRQSSTHLRLVEAPLFVEPIFDELKNEARREAAFVAPWSGPQVQLPRHQIVSEFVYADVFVDPQPLNRVQPAVRPRRVVTTSLGLESEDAAVPAPVAQASSRTLVRSAQRYRTRRLVAGIALCAAIYGVFSGASALAGTHQGSPVAIAGSVAVQGGFQYTVRSGDTLWSIASRVYPNGDPRPLVARLSAELGGRSPQPGQHLLLP